MCLPGFAQLECAELPQVKALIKLTRLSRNYLEVSKRVQQMQGFLQQHAQRFPKGCFFHLKVLHRRMLQHKVCQMQMATAMWWGLNSREWMRWDHAIVNEDTRCYSLKRVGRGDDP